MGKSLVAVGLAVALAKRQRVGLLDLDFRAPNIPYILGLPLEASYDREYRPKPLWWSRGAVGFPVFSTAIVYGDATSILMEGSLVRTAVRDFLDDVAWPELDMLVIDTDPSAADTLNGLRDTLKEMSAFIVTTPERSSLADSARMIDSCRELSIRVRGLVVNMAGTVCSSCGEPLACGGCGTEVVYGDPRMVEDFAARASVPIAATLPWMSTARADPVGTVSGKWARQFDGLAAGVLGLAPPQAVR